MARHPKPWTQDDDDVLREAVRGRPLWNICSQIDRTGPAVRSRIYVLGLSYRIIGPKTRRD
jgi:hypothetical protein